MVTSSVDGSQNALDGAAPDAVSKPATMVEASQSFLVREDHWTEPRRIFQREGPRPAGSSAAPGFGHGRAGWGELSSWRALRTAQGGRVDRVPSVAL